MVAFNFDLQDHLVIVLPAMAAEIIRHAADCIGFIAPDIPQTVAIKVNRISPVARRNELTISHSACVRSFQMQWVLAFFACQQQVLGEFPAEEFCPRRVVEGQRRQRIHDPVAARHPAVTGFHTQNCDHVLRRHTEPGFSVRQPTCVVLPEFQALFDSPLLQENPSVFVPLQRAFGRPGNGIEDALLLLGAAEQRLQFVPAEIVLGNEFVHVLDDICARGIVRMRRAIQRQGRQPQHNRHP